MSHFESSQDEFYHVVMKFALNADSVYYQVLYQVELYQVNQLTFQSTFWKLEVILK